MRTAQMRCGFLSIVLGTLRSMKMTKNRNDDRRHSTRSTRKFASAALSLMLFASAGMLVSAEAASKTKTTKTKTGTGGSGTGGSGTGGSGTGGSGTGGSGTGGSGTGGSGTSGTQTLGQMLQSITWMDYTPTNYNPSGVNPSSASIISDMKLLRKMGVTGLVTYSSTGIFSTLIPQLAKQEGFQGLIMGVWDPTSASEMASAQSCSTIPIVKGYCVGNEGLNDGRYTMAQLQSAITAMRSATGKPCTTTEVVDIYGSQLLSIGDWVYPNCHPYWHNVKSPVPAANWTISSLASVKAQTSLPVQVKECGLPTAGDTACSPANQQTYWQTLMASSSGNACNLFEGFDQYWKTDAPVEPYWGFFNSSSQPKPIATALTNTAYPKLTFTVYDENNSLNLHYNPSGWMGDTGDLTLNTNWTTNPHSGSSCTKVTYAAKGSNGWAGVYYLDPVGNWGTNGALVAPGYDLSLFNHIQLWVRADSTAKLSFFVGGVNNTYGDSQTTPISTNVTATSEWQLVDINLSSANLSHIIGGLGFTLTKANNPAGTNFYIDDVKFVHE